MTHSLETLFSAWGNPSAEARTALSEAVISPNITYCDPQTPDIIRGLDAYLAYITHFGDMMPGATARVVHISEHNNHARATVDFLRDGAAMMRGQYFAHMDGDQIQHLVGFPGMGDPA
ncbi:MAG: nuclear transport factor 2 family protein [Sedimentitalea sp.]